MTFEPHFTGALVLEAHHTTHIEGTKLSLDESERLLAGESVPGADPEDVRELLNYRDAFEFVSAWLGSGGPITEGLVREIHKRLVDGVRGGSAAPGEYRRLQNYVVNSATGAVIYTPPPAHDVPILMRELTDWLNRETIQDFTGLCPETNRRTLQRDLKALVDKGLLVGGGTAPTDPARHYRPAPGLM